MPLQSMWTVCEEMKPIEKELDRLVQMLSINHRCHICGGNAEAIHHIVGRANKVLRYELINLLPVCHACHRKIHDEGLDVSKYMAQERWQFLQEMKNKSYRDLLIFDYMMTEDEFFKFCKNELLKILRGQNEDKVRQEKLSYS